MQTVAMGLLIVFLDVPASGLDWVADPVGWLLVLLGLAAVKDTLPSYRGLLLTAWGCFALAVITWPATSLTSIDPSVGWAFSLPTIAWCFLVSDALHDALEGTTRGTFLWLRNVFVLVAALPVLVYGGSLDWLSTPTAVLAVGANLTLLYLLFTTRLPAEEPASAEDGAEPRQAVPPAESPREERPRDESPRRAEPKLTGAEVVARVRRRRGSRQG